jgi:transcriptional regulator GlxA family with amidase domain
MLLTGVRPSTHPQAHFKIQMESVADECVRRCVNLMEQALNDPPAIPYLAQEVGLSPRQLDRRFTKAVGKPPGRYFREMRLRYGSWLLTHTTDTVAQIAADTGFSDAAYFHREFRKQYGRSPKQYRQSVSASAVDIEADLKALV